MNGARAQAFEALGRVAARLEDGGCSELAARTLAAKITAAVVEIARPVSAPRIIQITAAAHDGMDQVYGLDADGGVWFWHYDSGEWRPMGATR